MLFCVVCVVGQGAFASVCAPKFKAERTEKREKKKRRKTAVAVDNFMPYRPKDYQSEQGCVHELVWCSVADCGSCCAKCDHTGF